MKWLKCKESKRNSIYKMFWALIFRIRSTNGTVQSYYHHYWFTNPSMTVWTTTKTNLLRNQITKYKSMSKHQLCKHQIKVSSWAYCLIGLMSVTFYYLLWVCICRLFIFSVFLCMCHFMDLSNHSLRLANTKQSIVIENWKELAMMGWCSCFFLYSLNYSDKAYYD